VEIFSLTVRPELVEGLHFTSEDKDSASTSSARTGLREVTLVAHVSKGTYIRSLARDIAYALGTCGHVTYLRRIKAGPFLQEQAISLDFMEETAKGRGLERLLLPLEAGLDDIPALHLDQTSAQAVRQGRVLSGMPQSSGLYLAKLGPVPVALMEISDGTATVVRGFNLPDVAE
jgi:tRNA pseudouridine55 synthase